MVDGIGRKSYNGVGRGRIGRWSLGRKQLTEKERQKIAKRKAMEWAERARHKLLKARDKLKILLHQNEKKSERKEMTRRRNINPLFFPLTPKFSRRGKPTFTHSTIPAKPKYSIAEPKERIYGKKWKRFPELKRTLHPAIKAAVEEIKIGIEEKAKIFKPAEKTEET